MFVKLFQQILDSSIADDRRLRHFFTDLLLCADSTGLVMMTHGAIARRIGASLEEVEWGLNALMQPDPHSKTPDNEGRRIEPVDGTGYGWKILNYEHYRAVKDAEQMRDTTRERVRRFRAKKLSLVTPGNVTVTAGNACNAMQKEKKRQKQKAEADPNSPPGPQGGEAAKAAPAPADDEAWICSLEKDSAYAGISIRQEFGKMQRWCEVNNKQATRRRFIAWINRAEKPMRANGATHRPRHQAYLASTAIEGMSAKDIGEFFPEQR